MREILFRGKRIDNGEWVYGSYWHYSCSNTHQHFVFNDDMSIWVSVDPDTVGQFAGLNDCNGVKIFEGDIVRYGDTIHRVVFEQRNGTAYFGLVYAAYETLPFGHYQDLKQIEVVGNIYDNPELLEVSSDE